MLMRNSKFDCNLNLCRGYKVCGIHLGGDVALDLKANIMHTPQGCTTEAAIFVA